MNLFLAIGLMLAIAIAIVIFIIWFANKVNEEADRGGFYKEK